MRTVRLVSIGVVTLLTTVASVQRTHAQFTVFTERSAWEAAVGAIDTEDFNDVPLQTLMTGPSFTFSEHRVGKISIGARGDRLGEDNNPTIRETVDHLSPNGSRHLGGILQNIEVIMQAMIKFDQPKAAFGADWASAANRTGVRLNINDETVELADHMADDGDGFFGIVADEPFQEVFLSSRAYEDYGIDNVKFPGSRTGGASV